MPRHLLALALACGLALPAAAQYGYDDPSAGDTLLSDLPENTYRKAPVRLIYDHVTRAWTLTDASGETVETWDRGEGPAFAEVPGDRPVAVEVRNANTLAYAYGLRASVREVREPPVSCGRQSRQFFITGVSTLTRSLISADPEAGATPDFTTGGIAGLLGLDPTALMSGARSRSLDGIQASSIPDALLVGQLALDRIQAVRFEVAQLRKATAAALQSAAVRAEVQPLGPLLDEIRSAMEESLQPQPSAKVDLRDPAQVPGAVAALTEGARNNLLTLAEVSAAIEADRISGGVNPALEADVVDLLAQIEAERDMLAQQTLALQGLAVTLAEAEAGTRQRFLLRPGYNLREVSLDVTVSPDSVVGTDRPARLWTRAGAVQAFLAPERRRGFSCSVVVSLAFTEPVPQYGVLGGAIQNDASDGLATSPAVLFEVAPPVLGSVLGVVGGVGLGRNFTPDLYAGGSFRLFDPVLVTGGAVWRRYDRLPSGVAVGDLLEDTAFEDDVAFENALDRGWTRSFFIGLSIAP